MALGTLTTVLDHDVVITSSDGSRLGMMLADVQQVKKAWHLAEVPAPSGIRVSSGGTSVQDSPPEMAASVFRTDNIAGMGPRISQNIGTFLLQNTDKDYMSGNVQTSVSGKIIKAPYAAEITLPTSEGNVRAMVEFGSAFYISDGRYLHRSVDGSAFTQVLDVGATFRISDLKTFGDTSSTTGILACVETDSTAETAQSYYFSTNGTTFTQATAAGNRQFNYMFVQDKTLYGLVNPSTFYTTTDPFVVGAIWGSATVVGDRSKKFQGGMVVAGVLVIFKEDKVYTVNSSGVVSTLIAQFADTTSTLNFHAFCAGWNSNIYMTVDSEVFEYDPVSGEIRQMGLSKLPDTQLAATATSLPGLSYDEDAIYATHATNLSSTPGMSVVRIVFDKDGTPQPERWVMSSLNGYRPQGALRFSRLFSSLGTGRHLWTATTTAGKVLRLTMPRAADPTTDTTSEYDIVDSTYRSGWMHHNFPAQWKDYTEVLIDMAGLTAVPPTSTVSVYYYLDGDLTTRHTLQTGISTNNLHSLEFSNGVSGRTFLLEIILSSADRQHTPQVLSWNVKASVKFDFREVITLSVRVGDHVSARNSTRSPHTAAEIRNRLRGWRAQTNITLQYQDYRGYTFTNIRILTGFEETDEVDDKYRGNETIMTIRIMRVSESTGELFIVGTDTVLGSHLIGP